MVVDARYGVLDDAAASSTATNSSAKHATVALNSDTPAGESPSDADASHHNGQAAAASDPGDDGSVEDGELQDSELPPQWLDVTVAVQFQVASGALVFHAGVAKSGLMGFCDPAPGQPKRLRVHYMYKGHLYRVELIDEVGLSLSAHLIHRMVTASKLTAF